MTGPCAKAVVRCTLITSGGERFVGENRCANPQPVCPRLPGEDYTKCRTVCEQIGHAEQVAVRLAGPMARGAAGFLEGHTYACGDCQLALSVAGVERLTIGPPPEPDSPILDDVFHGCSLVAFIEEARKVGGWPDSKAVKRRAYQLYEEELARKDAHADGLSESGAA